MNEQKSKQALKINFHSDVTHASATRNRKEQEMEANNRKTMKNRKKKISFENSLRQSQNKIKTHRINSINEKKVVEMFFD